MKIPRRRPEPGRGAEPERESGHSFSQPHRRAGTSWFNRLSARPVRPSRSPPGAPRGVEAHACGCPTEPDPAVIAALLDGQPGQEHCCFIREVSLAPPAPGVRPTPVLTHSVGGEITLAEFLRCTPPLGSVISAIVPLVATLTTLARQGQWVRGRGLSSVHLAETGLPWVIPAPSAPCSEDGAGKPDCGDRGCAAISPARALAEILTEVSQHGTGAALSETAQWWCSLLDPEHRAPFPSMPGQRSPAPEPGHDADPDASAWPGESWARECERRLFAVAQPLPVLLPSPSETPPEPPGPPRPSRRSRL